MSAPASRLLFHGGLVVDGTSNADPIEADVLVSGGRIEAVVPRNEPVDGAERVDCTNHVVAPGFIDIHTHSDLTRFQYSDGASRVLQGVTTEVIGNCGMSPMPITHGVGEMREVLGPVDAPDVPMDWASAAEFLDRLDDAPASTNVLPLIGHSSLRHAAMRFDDRSATPEELSSMRRMLEEALDVGIWGMSIGLMYAPGELADGEELAALGRTVADSSRLLAVHLRAYDSENLPAAVDEMLEISRLSECRLQISHLRVLNPPNGQTMARLLERLDAASLHLDVAADAYPYTAGQTTLLQLFTSAVRRLGVARIVELSQTDPSELAVDLGNSSFSPERIFITRVGAVPSRAVGKSFAELEIASGRPWQDVAVEFIANHGGMVDVLVFGSTEEDALTALTHRLVMIGSDGRALNLDHDWSREHPRSIGTYPRAIELLINAGVDLADAVYKATGQPAARLGITDRGVIAPGAVADIVVLDPQTLRDNATYDSPLVPPTGIRDVYVAGEAVVADCAATGARPGRLIRAES